MPDPILLPDLIHASAARAPTSPALTAGRATRSYAELAQAVSRFAHGLIALNLRRGERVGVYLEKRHETVIALFGASAAGGVIVPVNPILKPAQVAYILRDCNARALITSNERLAAIRHDLDACPDLSHVVTVGEGEPGPAPLAIARERFESLLEAGNNKAHRAIDSDVAAILYTSGSTGRPKGVVLSHRNMLAGARSVATYLENRASDALLAVLPLSFDAGLSQLTTGFYAGARVVLLNYLLPRDVVATLDSERITGLTAVPPLYIQLAQLSWPSSIDEHLRYFANTGGHMPLETLTRLRKHLPRARPFLMYGLTEAFRSTYLPPEEVDRRPDSIGKAIPNAEILVLREDGTPCATNEPGELVHRGALVGLGYWNDPEKTAERYKPLPHREAGLPLAEYAVFSGDIVRRDEEGFLYFIGRRDEMIKTSGYRVSPTEIEEVVYATQLVAEAAAFGVPHPMLGQAIVVVATPRSGGSFDERALMAACRERLPAFMVPTLIHSREGPLPRNPNGKIDRKALSVDFLDVYVKSDAAPAVRSAN